MIPDLKVALVKHAPLFGIGPDRGRVHIMKVSAIIPVLNEEERITAVVRAVEESGRTDEIIVVDDGSTDRTAEAASKTSAKVLRLPENRGKAAAMAAGVSLARNEILLFLDGDLERLEARHIGMFTDPVLAGRFAMYIGIMSRRTLWLNRILRFMPLLSGNRAMRREVWDAVPEKYREGFQIEIALNYFCRKAGYRLGFRRIPGVQNTIKEKKYGMRWGFWRRLKMSAEILWITWRLHFVHNVVKAVPIDLADDNS